MKLQCRHRKCCKR